MAARPFSHFDQVYNDYIAGLDQKPKKAHFIGKIRDLNRDCSIEELQDSVDGLVQRCADRKLRRWMTTFILPVVNGLRDYSDAINQVVSSYPMPTAIIWGGLKAVIEIVLRYTGSFEEIQSALQSLSARFFTLSSCDTLYSQSSRIAPTVQAIIGRSYAHIIDVWYKVTKQLSGNQLKHFAKATFRNDKLSQALDCLKEDAEELHKICQVAEAELQSETRETLAGLVEEFRAEKERDIIERAAAEEERKLNAAHRRHLERQLKKGFGASEQYQREARRRDLIESMKNENGDNADLLRDMSEHRLQGTCEWLFESDPWQRWTSPTCSKPIFWLQGKHGCGKSFICSAAIERIRSAPDQQHAAYIFVTRSRADTRTQLLRTLAYQLVRYLESQVGDISDDTLTLIRSCSTDPSCFESLISHTLTELPRIFVFLDGLDEATDEGDKSAEDMLAIMSFLQKEALNIQGKLRLWFSSQYRPELEATIRGDDGDHIIDLSVESDHTSQDIGRYLAQAIPESTQNAGILSQLLVTAYMHTEVEGSFLWAAQMVNDLRNKAESADDMVRLAEQGLPTKMHDHYRRLVNSYRQRPSSHRSLPLWKIILSLLAFARRPLRLFELREAIATMRTVTGENISPDKLVTNDDKIKGECSALVRYIKSQEDSENGTLRLSHSAVHTFVRAHSDESGECVEGDCSECHVVSADILRQCCLKYLLQARFATPLVRETSSQFSTQEGTLLKEHRFLLYAAKYWFRNCDDFAPSEATKALLQQLLLSSNFRTCLQIQSISIIGHFLVSYDKIRGLPRSMQRNLPSWINQIEDDFHKFQDSYKDFLREWHHLLQLGLSSQFNGEIDRILWQTLGPRNFLREGASRYKSFLIGSLPLTTHKASSGDCVSMSSSTDGTSVIVCGMNRESDFAIQVCVEKWALDGPYDPELVEKATLSVAVDQVKLSLFNYSCIQRMPLVPIPDDGTPLQTLRVEGQDGMIQVGSHVLVPAKQGSIAAYESIKEDDEGNYYEESCQSRDAIVLCRRRRPKNVVEEAAQEEAKRVLRNKKKRERNQGRTKWGPHEIPAPPKIPNVEVRNRRRMETRRQGVFRIVDFIPDDRDARSRRRMGKGRGRKIPPIEVVRSSDDEDFDNSSGPNSSSSNEDTSGSDPLSSSEESATSASDENSSSDAFSTESIDDLEIQHLTESDTEDTMESSLLGSTNSESEDTDDGDMNSLLSNPSSTFSDENDADLADPSMHLASDSATQPGGNNEMFDYPVEITTQSTSMVCCDNCFSTLREQWFRCAICEPHNGFDLCKSCLQNDGLWCYDKKHQLFECGPEGPRGVVSWSKFGVKQELHVFKSLENGDNGDHSTDNKRSREKMFTYTSSAHDLLHESSPILHTCLPIVIWPVCQERLLIADYDNNIKGTHTIRTTSLKARQLSVSLYLSPSSGYLHLGSVEAVRMRNRKGPRAKAPALELSFVLITLKLSSKDPCKRRPLEINRQTHSLGVWNKTLFATLPYSWTWTEQYAYFCVSGVRLRVYRVALPSATSPTYELPRSGNSAMKQWQGSLVQMPEETVFFPHSAQDRSVQFFPPQSSNSRPNDVSTIIIGPRYGPEPLPALGIYLKPEDLGDWIDADVEQGTGDDAGKAIGKLKRRQTGIFEDFDTDEDCDVIPFDAEG